MSRDILKPLHSSQISKYVMLQQKLYYYIHLILKYLYTYEIRKKYLFSKIIFRMKQENLVDNI